MDELNSRMERTKIQWTQRWDNRNYPVWTREKIDWGEKLDEDNLRDLWNYNKRSDIHVIRIPGEEKENGGKKVSREIMTESFSNLARGINLQM